MEFSVHEAKTQLSKLLDLVQDGQEVIIHRHGKRIARIISTPSNPQSPFGALRGEFEMAEGWDRPLMDEEAEAFWAGKW